MITRVTGQTQMRAAQRNLQENMTKMSQLQEKAGTLKAISRSSDDPTGAAVAMSVRAEARAVDQYSRNADNGDAWLNTLDSAMNATSKIMNQVRDLTVQGANAGALSPTAKEAIAVAIDGLKKDLLTQANTSYVGRNVFAGSSDAGVAFTPDGSFTGASGASVDRRISANSTVRVDADGGAVFGTGTDSVFKLLDTIAADLRAGTNVGTHLAAIDSRMGIMVGQYTDIGARQAQIERAQGALVEKSGLLEAQRSGVEDLDLGQAILDLKLQEVTYQSALAVTARVLQPTLMDFLR